MTHSELAGRIRGSVKQWLHDRLQECLHCSECGAAVTPWDSHCPQCGQENPARVSASAAIGLVIGTLCLAFAILVLAF
jgi:uncharacterized OB-fold protein